MSLKENFSSTTAFSTNPHWEKRCEDGAYKTSNLITFYIDKEYGSSVSVRLTYKEVLQLATDLLTLYNNIVPIDSN